MEFASVEQDDFVPYGTTVDMQSFALICDTANGAFKAVLTPIKRMYENRIPEVDVEVLSSGSPYQRLSQHWMNAWSDNEDTPAKYVISSSTDASKLIRFLVQAKARGHSSATFLFPGDEEGKASDQKNGLIRIDVQIEDITIAVATLRRECKKLHR